MKEIKTCTKCGEAKEAGEFYSRGPDGWMSECKACVALRQREYYNKNRGRINECFRIRRKSGEEAYERCLERAKKDRALEKSKEKENRSLHGRKSCSSCGEEKHIEEFWWKSKKKFIRQPICSMCFKEMRKKYQRENKELIRQRQREYRKRNLTDLREKSRLRAPLYRERMKKENPSFRIKEAISSRIRRALLATGKKKNGACLDNLPYSLEQLKLSIELQFEEGMSWSNYGEWHIDHIIPHSFFNYDSMEHPDFEKCWSLANLRPLWAEENLKKAGSLNHDEKQITVAKQLNIFIGEHNE